MDQVAPAIPRAIDAARLADDPIAFLARARADHGDAVIIREGAPLFSPSHGCPAVVALFGAEWHRRVLMDARSFAIPESAARALALPETLINLNHSLHSMRGRAHGTQKRLLSAITGEAAVAGHRAAIALAVAEFAQAWRGTGTIAVLGGMRRLMVEIAAVMLFGDRRPDRAGTIAALEGYFNLRRALSSPLSRGRTAPAEVVAAGERLDALLRDAIRDSGGGRGPGGAIVERLVAQNGFTEAELVAHINVLFMSIIEPVTVASTWLLLILTQRPALRERMRGDGGTGLLEHVALETLRLLSPNALMTRVTARAVDCGGIALPEGCEIVLAPILAHRDPAVFPRPLLFDPQRWAGARPSAFEYFPFGAGPHACVGRRAAMALIALVVAELLRQVDPVLAAAQPIDWEIDITFHPRGDVLLSDSSQLDAPQRSIVQWSGPIEKLLQFEPYVT